MKTYLLLGSNIGDRLHQLKLARGMIQDLIAPIISASSIYETAAWGKENQSAFLNQAVGIDTVLQPLVLLDQIKFIEKKMGREQAEKWAPRVIDIDILLMGNIVFRSPSLGIPHPQLHLRRFTLQPLAEIAAEQVHPQLHLNIRVLLDHCPDRLDVKIHQNQQALPEA